MEYIIQKWYVIFIIFLYHDTYLDDCINMYRNTQCIILPLTKTSEFQSSHMITESTFIQNQLETIRYKKIDTKYGQPTLLP